MEAHKMALDVVTRSDMVDNLTDQNACVIETLVAFAESFESKSADNGINDCAQHLQNLLNTLTALNACKTCAVLP
jgi:hypothetical protein